MDKIKNTATMETTVAIADRLKYGVKYCCQIWEVSCSVRFERASESMLSPVLIQNTSGKLMEMLEN